jgi:ribonuclease HI
MDDRIIIYADGSVIGNGSENSKCGWAVKLIYKNTQKIKSGTEKGRTNNYMEMMAVLQGMKSILNKKVDCIVYSDSKYVIETLNGIFRVGANEELWNELFSEKESFDNIRFEWVRGHDKNIHNNEVDKAAYSAALSLG